MTEAAPRSEATDWALFQNDHWLTVPTFAAQIVKKTAQTVTYRVYRAGEDEAHGESKRLARAILADGLTRQQAERAAELDASSRAMRDQEVKVAERRHAERRAQIVAEARAETETKPAA